MRVSTGIDIEANLLGNFASTGTGSFAAASVMALSSNATAPAAGDTTLAGEYATSGGGLVAKQTSFTHTAGVTSYANGATFTANATDGASNIVNKFCLRQSITATATNMLFETAMPSPPTLIPSDSVAVTDTVSI